MAKIRVLVVDDSVAVRRVLTEILQGESDMEVVGAAGSGAVALLKIDQLNPDVVTLDVEMPDVSGLELLDEVRKKSPRLPIIMFSSLTHRAAATTLDALARGATDYATKPSDAGSREAAAAHVRATLVPKIRLLGARPAAQALPVQNRAPLPLSVPPQAGRSRVEILAVGASTGGPNALAEVFRSIPSLSVPVVIVQHMPPLFTKLLAERLSASCPLQFREATHGDLLEPGVAWIAPGDHHMRVVRDGTRCRIAIDHGPPENSCRPAVDPLFQSVAEVFGARALAVMLTGMGQDGFKGCEALSARGATIVAQDEQSSVVWGMPGIVVKAGLASAVLPLGEIAADILRRTGLGSGDSTARRAQERSHAG